MKVILTGASGFIGKHIAGVLCDQNIQVVALSRTKPTGLPIDFIQFNLVNPNYEKLNQIGTIDAIIHCSSIMADSSNLKNYSLLYDNLKMSETVVELCKMLNVKQLINLSSIAIYPNIDGEYSEKSMVKVSDNNDAIYGLSKLCAENLYDFLLGKKEKKKVVNLRISQVYGVGMRTDRTYHIMLNELKEKNTVTVFSNGIRVSNFVSVEKVVKVVLFFLTNNENTGVYNLGGENLSYQALAQKLINEHGNANSKVILVDRGVQSKFYLNTNKLSKLMGDKLNDL